MGPEHFEYAQRQARKDVAIRERQNRRIIEKAERHQTRLQPFEELAKENRGIAKRAQKIFSLMPPPDPEQSAKTGPWIVLREGSEASHSWVLGFVEEAHLDRFKYYTFKVYVTDVDSATRAKEKPLGTHIKAPSPMTESTYRQTAYSEEIGVDHILMIAEDETTGAFNPILAWKRLRLKRTITAELSALQETATMFETALVDSHLNPHLVEWVESAGIEVSKTEAA